MNGNPIYEQSNHIHEFTQNAKDVKTAAEHTAIIQKFRATGYLNEQDRQDALDKYRQFNFDHPDYSAMMSVTAIASNNLVNMDSAEDSVIVGNLNAQLAYLCGKNLLNDVHSDKQRL